MTRRWPEFRKYLFPLLANPQNSGRNRRNRSLFATATKSRRYQESSCRYIIQIASSEHILYLAITILSAFTSSHEIPSSFLRLVRAITSSFLSFVVHAFVCLCACVCILCVFMDKYRIVLMPLRSGAVDPCACTSGAIVLALFSLLSQARALRQIPSRRTQDIPRFWSLRHPFLSVCAIVEFVFSSHLQ